jgi:hypothetical protein
MRDTVCVGASDHLPYHLTTSGGWAVATYEWNPEISVNSPTPVLARPKGFIDALPDLSLLAEGSSHGKARSE